MVTDPSSIRDDRPTIHHYYHPSREYNDELERRFRELPWFKVPYRFDFHVWYHSQETPPEKPHRKFMEVMVTLYEKSLEDKKRVQQERSQDRYEARYTRMTRRAGNLSPAGQERLIAYVLSTQG